VIFPVIGKKHRPLMVDASKLRIYNAIYPHLTAHGLRKKFTPQRSLYAKTHRISPMRF
jgi:hypothetical protein